MDIKYSSSLSRSLFSSSSFSFPPHFSFEFRFFFSITYFDLGMLASNNDIIMEQFIVYKLVNGIGKTKEKQAVYIECVHLLTHLYMLYSKRVHITNT